MRHELPGEFENVYDADRYKLSQEYLKVNTRFGWLVSMVNTIGLLFFWFMQGFQFLDVWVRSLTTGPVISGVLYIGILALAASIVSLPFSIYATFVIEERFGFNRMTWLTFVKDRVKGLLLGITLGVPLLVGILAFFEYAGSYAWLYCWLAATVYSLVVQFIAPVWIMPLFNKFTPLEEGELRTAIVDYARSIQFPLDNIFVMDGSRRSKKSNAFFTGFGRYRRIVLFDTLLEKHTASELLAVLAHEMGHYKKKHILKSFLFGIIQTGLMFYLLSIFISYPGLFEAFFMEQISVYAGLVFFAMLYAPFELFFGIFLRAFSRKNEFEADRFSVQTTGDPKPMIAALKKLTVDNLSNLLPHPFYVFLNYSHPPVMQRINAINHFSSLSKS
jgi:STE24 endopeptidase